MPKAILNLFKKKLGKVILRETNKIVNGVVFSNSDMLWYDLGGKLHPMYNNYVGKPLHLKFSFKCEDKHGIPRQLEGVFSMPFALGKMVRQDLELLEEQMQIGMEEAAKAYKLNGNNSKEWQRATDILTNVCGPGLHILAGVGRNEHGKRIQYAVDTLLFIWDDFLDKLNSREPLEYEKLSKLVYHFGEVLYGRESCYCDDNDKTSPIDMEEIYNFEKTIQYVRETALVDQSEADAKYFFAVFMEYLNAAALETSREWNEINSTSIINPDVEHYRKLAFPKLVTTIKAVKAAVESFALAKGIRLEEEIRNSFIFQTLMELAEQNIGYVNDIFSFHKEKKGGNLHNIVADYHMRQEMSLENAVKATVDKINSITVAIEEAGNLLLKLYPDSKQLNAFVELVKSSVFGHIQWYSLSLRYHPDLVFDCIV